MDELSLSTDNYEAVCINSGNFVFSVLYRSPDGDLNQFFDSLDVEFSSGMADGPATRFTDTARQREEDAARKSQRRGSGRKMQSSGPTVA
ncbi:hypothetical protein V5799_032137 [Amblyomma americanum]|uniref:Uncharacterized protein n=1 Tax=Amblyomma americanum TaxID=6943 RepID=A0AAQ4DS13_AMBAM